MGPWAAHGRAMSRPWPAHGPPLAAHGRSMGGHGASAKRVPILVVDFGQELVSLQPRRLVRTPETFVKSIRVRQRRNLPKA